LSVYRRRFDRRQCKPPQAVGNRAGSRSSTAPAALHLPYVSARDFPAWSTEVAAYRQARGLPRARGTQAPAAKALSAAASSGTVRPTPGSPRSGIAPSAAARSRNAPISAYSPRRPARTAGCPSRSNEA